MRPSDLTPFLDEHERVESGFDAGSGPSWAVWLSSRYVFEDPRVVIYLPLVYLLRIRRYRVVITDRGILVVRLSMVTGKPRDVIRLPRETQLGPFEGRGWIRLGGIRMFAPEMSDKRAVQDADERAGFPRPVPGLW